MNNIRRKSLSYIKEKIEELNSELELILEDELEYIDNIPANLLYSERYEKAEDAVSALEEAIGNMEEAIDNIEEAIA